MPSILFDKEASCWNEALPVGNGLMGAMVFGGTCHERIQLNEDSLWSGGPQQRINPDARSHLDEVRSLLADGKVGEAELLASRSMLATNPHMRHYQSLGDLWMEFADAHGPKMPCSMGGVTYIACEAKPCTGYRRSLDLESSLGSLSYELDGTSHHREFFASAPDDVLVYRLDASRTPRAACAGSAVACGPDDQPTCGAAAPNGRGLGVGGEVAEAGLAEESGIEGSGLISFELSATRKDNRHGRGASYCDDIHAERGDTIVMCGRQGGAHGIGFAMAVRVLAEGGRVYSMGSHIVVEGARAATLLICARTTFRARDPLAWCREALDAGMSRPYRELRERAVADYRRLWNSCTLRLPHDPALDELPTHCRLERVREGAQDAGLAELYFGFARYLLISSSRPGSLPATLQGIWNEEFEPAWGSKYTININIQMNYWLAEKTGLSELHLPLIEHLGRMVGPGSHVASEMYGCRGFCCHHNTDIWGDCAPQDTHLSASIWPMGAAWLSLHLIEHWDYTHDEAFVARFLPVLREAVLFFVDYLVRDADGYWVSGPSTSPENTYLKNGSYGNLCMGPAMDSEILRELFSGYLGLVDELGSSGRTAALVADDAGLRDEVAERLAGLRPIEIGACGQICEWSCDYEEAEPGHRHVSQLFALYPAAQIRPDTTPELARAAELTLDRRLASGGGHTGWSKAWIVLLYDRLGRGEKAWGHFFGLLAYATLPNLFDNHPPFQIDGNFGGAAGVLEMLVRDYGDSVWLLPALPEALGTGSVSGVRLRRGAVLDMEWHGGSLSAVRVRGSREGLVSLRLPDGATERVPISKGSDWKTTFEEED